jgi:hypothetical protein
MVMRIVGFEGEVRMGIEKVLRGKGRGGLSDSLL